MKNQSSMILLDSVYTNDLAELLTIATDYKFHPLPKLSPDEGRFQASLWLEQQQEGKQCHYLIRKSGDIIGHVGFLGRFEVDGRATGDAICHFDPSRTTRQEVARTIWIFLKFAFRDLPSESGRAVDEDGDIADFNRLSAVSFIVHKEDLIVRTALEDTKATPEINDATEGPGREYLIRREPFLDNVSQLTELTLAAIPSDLISMNWEKKLLADEPQPVASNQINGSKTVNGHTKEQAFRLIPIDFTSDEQFEALRQQRILCGWYTKTEELRAWQAQCDAITMPLRASSWVYMEEDKAYAGHVSYETLSTTQVKISQLFIMPQYRNYRLASRVVTALEERARNDPHIDEVLIDTLSKNYWYQNTMERVGTWLKLGHDKPRLRDRMCLEDWYVRRAYTVWGRGSRWIHPCISGCPVRMEAVDLKLDVSSKPPERNGLSDRS